SPRWDRTCSISPRLWAFGTSPSLGTIGAREPAKSFDNPDWADVVLHSYRHRWQLADGDPAYAALEAKLTPPPIISVPTLVLHGGPDGANEPMPSGARERPFSGLYPGVVPDGVGHFPSREAPKAVGEAIAAFLARPSS